MMIFIFTALQIIGEIIKQEFKLPLYDDFHFFTALQVTGKIIKQ